HGGGVGVHRGIGRGPERHDQHEMVPGVSPEEMDQRAAGVSGLDEVEIPHHLFAVGDVIIQDEDLVGVLVETEEKALHAIEEGRHVAAPFKENREVSPVIACPGWPAVLLSGSYELHPRPVQDGATRGGIELRPAVAGSIIGHSPVLTSWIAMSSE